MAEHYAGCGRRAALPRQPIPHRGPAGVVIRWRSEPPASTLAGVTRTIERVDPADGTAMRAVYDVWRAAYLEDDPDNPLPTLPEIVARATAPHRSVVEEFWSLRDGDEVVGCMRDLRRSDVNILTLGQYLRPTNGHLPVARYYTPEEFAELHDVGMRLGFTHVQASPLTRSSYHAWEQARAAATKAD